MQFKIWAITALLLFVTGTANAVKYSQKEFDEMVGVYQMMLDNRQEQFDQAIEQDAPYEVVVEKACLYTGTWHRFLKIGKDNSNLIGAKEVIRSSTKMTEGLEEFFEALGSTYKATCE